MFYIRSVESNQTELHPRLDEMVLRHVQHAYKRPPSAPTRAAFEQLQAEAPRRSSNRILDTGCGTGESSASLAKAHPDSWVIGVDRSYKRLDQAGRVVEALPENLTLLRADLVDFWLLAAQAGWRFDKVYLLFPNPWPKSEHLQRRWHGHAIWPYLLATSAQIELRSNWELYLQEFARALELSLGSKPDVEDWQPDVPISAFERKYSVAGQSLWRLQADVSAFSLSEHFLSDNQDQQQQA